MPANDFISELLEIKDIDIKKIENTSSESHIYFRLKRRDVACPRCGAVTDMVHDYRMSVIKDSPVQGRRLFLHYSKRRYHCPCCNSHFYEPFPLTGKHCRITSRLNHLSVHELRNTQNVSSVADKLGISPASVFRFMRSIKFPKPQALPRVLSIDEFKGNAGEKFQGILTDAKNRKLFDILPSRSQHRLIDYIKQFSNRKDVRYIIMDMNRVYRDMAEAFLPNATIVIDRFHVVRYVTWAVENVRKRIQKGMHPSKRKYFKRSRRLLLTHFSKLDPDSVQALEIMLRQSADLAQAYHLKELFYDFMGAESRPEATLKLKRFILAAEVSGLKEFGPCLTMLGNWGKYILNAFDCPYTNGFTEGMNNRIKVIKRNAYGYRNFENFRNRILLSVS